MSSLKEAKIAGVESHFIGTYGKLRDYAANLIVTVAILNVLPRAATEVTAILVLAVIASSILISGRNEAELLPVFGLFALAALRFLPSANRILYCMVKIRTSSPQVDEIIRECDRLGLTPTSAILPARSDVNISAEITMKGVSYKYPDAEKLAIRDVSLMARPGEIVGIAGRSGAGKSTITNLILGLVKPNGGVIKYGDLNIDYAAAPCWQMIRPTVNTNYQSNITRKRRVWHT